MTQGLQRESAVIIPFVQRARLTEPSLRRGPAASRTPQVAVIPAGGCWYHDAAIREDESKRKS